MCACSCFRVRGSVLAPASSRFAPRARAFRRPRAGSDGSHQRAAESRRWPASGRPRAAWTRAFISAPSAGARRRARRRSQAAAGRGGCRRGCAGGGCVPPSGSSRGQDAPECLGCNCQALVAGRASGPVHSRRHRDELRKPSPAIYLHPTPAVTVQAGCAPEAAAHAAGDPAPGERHEGSDGRLGRRRPTPLGRPSVERAFRGRRSRRAAC